MKYSMFIGRWQPWHNGHRWLIDQRLKEGKNVLICIREVDSDDKTYKMKINLLHPIDIEKSSHTNFRKLKIFSLFKLSVNLYPILSIWV